ncbi:MAG: hypothetical protein GC151_02945 [Betaproteobacteria bacterium]|nr:hypothetical protein [Betaproteobacteria bacterium]
MALPPKLRDRLEELANLDPEDLTGWMHLYTHEAQQILAIAEDAEVLRAIRSLVLDHNVTGQALRTLLASPTTETLQGLVQAPREKASS